MRDILNRMPVIHPKQDQPRTSRANVSADQSVDLSFTGPESRSNRPGNSKLPGSSTTVCSHCRRKGHDQFTCYDKHAEQAPWAKLKASNRGKDPQHGYPIASSSGLDPARAAAGLPHHNQEASAKSAVQPAAAIQPSDWILDSGCGAHSTPMSVDRKSATNASLRMANGAVVQAASVGSKSISFDNGVLDLPNVRHVPSLDAGLLSMGKSVRDGWRFCQQEYDGHHFIIFESPDR